MIAIESRKRARQVWRVCHEVGSSRKVGFAFAPFQLLKFRVVAVGITGTAAGLFLNTLVMMLVYLVLYVALAYLIVDKCCDVIDILPSNVMSWINIRANGGNNDMDQRITAIGGKIEGETRATMAGMGGKPDNDKNRDGKHDTNGRDLKGGADNSSNRN